MQIHTIFESENLIIVDKPPLWLSVPGRLGEEDARPCLGTTLQTTLGCKLYPVHRLDYEVSGLIMFAKNAAAHRKASQWFEDKKIQKIYHAWTEGTVPESWGAERRFEWYSKLLRGKKRAYEHKVGKESITIAELHGPSSMWGQNCLAWELRPVTGRSHQLRFELFKHGFPILGDVLYGAKNLTSTENHGIALKAVKLDLSKIPENLRLGLPALITLE